jgi:hypothetical protein
MKRIGIAALVAVAATLALSAIGPPSASALCREVLFNGERSNWSRWLPGWGCIFRDEAGVSAFSDSNGQNKAVGDNYCYQVAKTDERSEYSDPSCATKTTEGKGGYFLSPEAPVKFLAESKQGTVKATSVGLQKYTFENGSIVACEKLASSTSTGEETYPESLSPTLLVTYSSCEAFGSAVTLTTAELLFDANGSIGYGNSDKLVITSNVGKCSILVFSGAESSGNEALGTIKYKNNGNGTITSEGTVKGIKYEVHGKSGGVCGTNKEVGASTYEGSTTFELVGGTIKVE